MAFDPKQYLAKKEAEIAKSTQRISDPLLEEASGVGAPPEQAPAFDPKAYLAKKDPSLAKKLEAGLEGFGQAVTFGYLPQLQAGAAGIIDKIAGFEGEDYTKTRDQFIKRGEALQEAAPGSYLGGQAAGTANSLVLGSGLLRAASKAPMLARAMAPVQRLGAAKKAALAGAATGAVYNPGDVEGETAGLQLGERAKNAAIGGVVGGGSQLAARGAAGLLRGWADKGKGLEKASDMMAVTSAGAKTGELRKLFDKQTLERVGKFLKDEGLVGAGKTVNETLEGAKTILDDTGKQLAAIYRNAQGQVLSPAQMADELGAVFEKELRGKAGGRQILARVQGELDNLKDLGDVADLEKVLEFRRGIDDLINYDKAVRDMPGAQQALKKMRDFLKEKIESEIETMRPEDVKALKELNKRYWAAAEVETIGKRAVAREESKMILGLPELIVGSGVGVGGAVNDAVQGRPEDIWKSLGRGLVAGGLMKAGRKYGPGAMTAVADKGGKLLQKDPTQYVAAPAAGLLNKIPPGLLGASVERIRKDNKQKKRKQAAPSGEQMIGGVE